MANFLAQWDDPALETPEVWDTDEYIEAQTTRLIEMYVLAWHAEQVPRRLGPDAAPSELSHDKRVSKKTRTRALTALRMWGGQPADAEEAIALHQEENDELRIQGVQVIWPKWWEDTRTYLQAQLRFIATTAIRTGQTKEGNRFANRILNELNILGQVHEPAPEEN